MKVIFYYKNSGGDWKRFNPKFDEFVLKISRENQINDSYYNTDSEFILNSESESYNFFLQKLKENKQIEIKVITGGAILFFKTEWQSIDEDFRLIKFKLISNNNYSKFIENKDVKVNILSLYNESKKTVKWLQQKSDFFLDYGEEIGNYDITDTNYFEFEGTKYLPKIGQGGTPLIFQDGDINQSFGYQLDVEEVSHPVYKFFGFTYEDENQSAADAFVIENNRNGEKVFPNAIIGGLNSFNDSWKNDQYKTTTYVSDRAMEFDKFLLHLFKYFDNSLTTIDMNAIKNYECEEISNDFFTSNKPFKNLMIIPITDLLFVNDTQPDHPAVNGYITLQSVFGLFEKIGIVWKIENNILILDFEKNIVLSDKKINNFYGINYEKANLNYDIKIEYNKGVKTKNNITNNLAFGNIEFTYIEIDAKDYKEIENTNTFLVDLEDINLHQENYDDKSTEQFVLLSTNYNSNDDSYYVRDPLEGIYRYRKFNKELSDRYLYENFYCEYIFNKIEISFENIASQTFKDGESFLIYEKTLPENRYFSPYSKDLQIFVRKLNDFTIFERIKIKNKTFKISSISYNLTKNVVTLKLE